ncbi:MAG: class II fructose-bisphosphatase [Caldilineae bacterium]|nr:MAG: class II fructose-bisphosphatase [Caldilineae bacterium]
MEEHPPRNLGLDLVRVTEAAALAAGWWLGRGRHEDADEAAAQAMYEALNTLDMEGRIVIGEERKVGRHSPLDSGTQVGTGYGPAMDVVADPIDGARLLMHGRSGALAVVAVAPLGSMWTPGPAVYMEKLVVDRDVARGLVPECLDAPAAWTLALIARLKQKPVSDLTVFMLERPRHEELVDEIRAAGARVWLRADGDIAGALIAATPNSNVDALMGVGGVTEGILAACAVRALGGAMLGRLAPQSAEERAAVLEANMDIAKIMTCDDLVSSDEIFFAATGITDGPILRGIRHYVDRAETESLILRGETGTRRHIHAEHTLRRLFKAAP